LWGSGPVRVFLKGRRRRRSQIWDATTGQIQRVYRKLTETEFTSVALDSRHRKFVTGDQEGVVKVWHYTTGMPLNTLPAHGAEVNQVIPVAPMVFASVSNDRSVHVCEEETEEDAGRLLRGMRTAAATTSCAAAAGLDLLAAGTRDHQIDLFSMHSGVQQTSLKGHHGEVTAMLMLESHGVLLSADSEGR
jgi:WD40 repeat protein